MNVKPKLGDFMKKEPEINEADAETELELSENLTIAPLHCFSKALIYIYMEQ